ncbi:MAG: MATE family efflux transporter [Firmicutes bacterium]|nr:MATE family efflux transporter [Bacillota bacterium]
MNDKHDLTIGPVWGKLFSFFIPIAAGAIVQQLYNTVDALIVGKYCGTESFAAISGSVTQVLNLMIGSFIALTGGASVYIAQLYGIKDEEKIKKAVSTAMYFCAALGIVLSVLGYAFARPILQFMKTPPETLDEAAVYLRLCFAAAFAVMLYNMGAGIIRAAGDSSRPFAYLCACCFTNIILDYILVKVYDLGVFGAAAATAFSQLISFTLVLIRMLTAKDAYRFRLSFKNLSLTAIKATVKYGLPSAVQQILYGITNTTIQVGINSLGASVVAAWALTGKVDGIYWAIVNAGGVAVMNFVGQNYGAGNIDRVKEVTKKGLRNFMIFTIAICVLLIAFGRFLFPLFLPDDDYVCDLAYKLMLYFVIPYFLWTFIEILGGVLKGCGDVIVPAAISLVGIAGVRLVWINTVFKMYPNAYVLALAYGVSWVVTAAALIVRYVRGKWKKRRDL